MNRRDALCLMAGGCSAAAVSGPAHAAAADPPSRTGLGLVIYSCSLRQKAEQQGDPRVNLFEPFRFLEHAHRLGAGGVQVPLGIRDAEYARRLRERAQAWDMFIEGSVSPPRDRADLDRFEAEMRTATAAGAMAVRTVVFPGRRYENFASREQFQQADQQARNSLELAAPVAARHRVRLAVENHKDHRVEERIELLKRISSPWVGACVDVGNSLSLLEDPLEVVEAYAPWAFCVHLKDHAVREYNEGFLLADVPLGEGFLDLAKMIAVLRKAKPEIRFCLELITRDPLKVPCLTDKYWASFTATPARDLARTLRIVRRHRAETSPDIGRCSQAEQVAREDHNIQASLRFARERLGL